MMRWAAPLLVTHGDLILDGPGKAIDYAREGWGGVAQDGSKGRPSRALEQHVPDTLGHILIAHWTPMQEFNRKTTGFREPTGYGKGTSTKL